MKTHGCAVCHVRSCAQKIVADGEESQDKMYARMFILGWAYNVVYGHTSPNNTTSALVKSLCEEHKKMYVEELRDGISAFAEGLASKLGMSSDELMLIVGASRTDKGVS